MTWSNKRLAETLDEWFLNSRAIITETAGDIVVGKLTAEDTLSLLDALEALGWSHAIEDDTGSVVSRSDIEQDFCTLQGQRTQAHGREWQRTRAYECRHGGLAEPSACATSPRGLSARRSS
ncbi:hypothetical protein Q1M63_03445 (plasmid) [Sinorhizobium meliloti]|nr:hypothetical protein Q1M63_03445 [Sinorhizobium meliloti]